MPTETRRYPTVPANVSPDVPHYVNLALREIDADVTRVVADVRAYTNQEVSKDRQRLGVVEAADAVQARRLAALETLGGLNPGNMSDAAVAALLLNPASNTAKEVSRGHVRRRELSYNPRDYGAVPNTDCIAAFEACVEDMPVGATLWVEPLPEGQRYLFSRPWIVNKQITIAGATADTRSIGVFGSVLRPITAAAQAGMRALVQVTSGYVKLRNISIVGYGQAHGSVGLLFSGGAIGGNTPEGGMQAGATASHGSNTDGVITIQFGAGTEFGSDSDHISLHRHISAGNLDGLRIASKNRFDFLIADSLVEGNVRSSLHLPNDANTENVTFLRSHLGFSPYGILQDDPITPGWGISALSLIDSPIEAVTEQHIKLSDAGNIRVQGGYWTWKHSAVSSKPAFEVRNVNKGPIWFSPKLEPNWPNENSPSVIGIPGYTNHPIYIDTALNNFSQKIINWGGSVDMKRVFVNGFPLGGQEIGVRDVEVTERSTTAVQTILSHTPLVTGLFEISAYLRVVESSTVTLEFSYNNGASTPIHKVVNNQVLAPGDYSYTFLARCATFSGIGVRARSSSTAAGAVLCSANITPKRSN